MQKPELLIDGLDFGEGPRWHDGLLWYSDFFQHSVYTVSPDGRRELVLDLDTEQPSGLGWLPNGDLLVVAMLERKLIRKKPLYMRIFLILRLGIAMTWLFPNLELHTSVTLVMTMGQELTRKWLTLQLFFPTVKQW